MIRPKPSHHRSLLTAVALGTLLVTSATAAVPRAGALDPLFGTNGITRADLGADLTVARLARQADGSLLAACELRPSASNPGDTQFGLVRFHPDGALDTTFGVSGLALEDFGDLTDPDKSASVGSIQIDPQGRIVAAGSVSGPLLSQFVLARYRPDGTPDPTFGQNGRVTGSSGTLSDLRQTALQSNGYVVAAGSSTLGGDQSILLVRYKTNGMPDPDFGVAGRVVTPLGNSSRASSVVIRPNGKIVVGGTVGDDACVLQYLPDGRPDPSFGNGGLVAVNFRDGQDEFNRIALQPDGRIVAGGGSYAREGVEFVERPVLVRITTRGKVDRAFGVGGAFRGSAGGHVRDLVLQKNGRIVTVGADAGRFTVSRLTAAGKPDKTFGTNGTVVVAPDARSEAVLLEPDGKITAAGRAEVEDGPEVDLLLTRLLAR